MPPLGLSRHLSEALASSLSPISMQQSVLAHFCAGWYLVVVVVCAVGRCRLTSTHGRPPRSPIPPKVLPLQSLPFVSILRPIKGDDVNLELCLSSACLLDYPKDRFEVLLCIASLNDPALPAIEAVIQRFPDINIRLFDVEEDVGPNPKIRNLSRAYREARGDIVWILDCNVWVPPGILKRSVTLLEGIDGDAGYKLVHHLPICVDTTPVSSGSQLSDSLAYFGGRLEENFMSSSHAKFYTAINTISVAPCLVGKSNMFRRSHLAEVTHQTLGDGLQAFSEHICEDQMIGDRLWWNPVQDELSKTRKWKRHGLGQDVVFQPIDNMSLHEYLARRTRWIRVRKYAVLLATLVEPMTESILCSLMGAYSATTLPALASFVGNSWTSFWAVWGCSMVWWAVSDRLLFNALHSYPTTPVDSKAPEFIVRRRGRGFGAWLAQWIGREIFAPVVWLWAMYPGYVNWRGGLYRVRWKDLKVDEIRPDATKND
ncbi:hypothetical protein EX30DRAFT_352007 [Ascodesmis nigricans]|uniref:Ceramide glucosyltransferase n=1 Tax=Ascodesmis nigricans TaxID=341454 RepID=A0A4S2MK24_9PEZI|nr:hypothetical protein EX30DRAFT_352007 [Ascodesmis nigricans]